MYRSPRQAIRIPLAVNMEDEAEMRESARRCAGTSPQGRELIRKHVWAVQQQMMEDDLNKKWAAIRPVLSEDLFETSLAIQDEDTRRRILQHLTNTDRWPMFHACVENALTAFEPLRYGLFYSPIKTALEFFKAIAHQTPASGVASALNVIFPDQSQFAAGVESSAASAAL